MSEILQVAGWSWKQKWWPLVKQTHKVMVDDRADGHKDDECGDHESVIEHNHTQVENHTLIQYLQNMHL